MLWSGNNKSGARCNSILSHRAGAFGELGPAEPFVEALHEAFLTMQVARITYDDGEKEKPNASSRPNIFCSTTPVWYVLAYDPGRGAIRTFRCDRLQAVQPHEETFSLRRVEDFRAGLEGLDIIVP